MKNMKKNCVLWIFALLMLAFGMSSCSSDDDSSPAADDSSPAEEENRGKRTSDCLK